MEILTSLLQDNIVQGLIVSILWFLIIYFLQKIFFWIERKKKKFEKTSNHQGNAQNERIPDPTEQISLVFHEIQEIEALLQKLNKSILERDIQESKWPHLGGLLYFYLIFIFQADIFITRSMPLAGIIFFYIFISICFRFFLLDQEEKKYT